MEFCEEFGGDVIRLVNLKEVDEEKWSVYIGRENKYYGLSESIFANPYTTDEYERETAVRLYELWLFRKLFTDEEFFTEFVDLRGEVLACWCLPESCHGQVLCSAVVAYVNDELESHIRNRFNQLEVNLFGFAPEKAETRGVLVENDVLE